MKKTNLKKNNKGFSLVELIVVICIMAVLVAILAPQFMKFVGQSKNAADAQQIEEIETNMKTCATDLPAGTYTIEVYATGNAKVTEPAGSTEFAGLFAEYAGANWATKTHMKSDDYANGVKVEMVIEANTFKTTVNATALQAPVNP